jgi:hypothetical protein
VFRSKTSAFDKFWVPVDRAASSIRTYSLMVAAKALVDDLRNRVAPLISPSVRVLLK